MSGSSGLLSIASDLVGRALAFAADNEIRVCVVVLDPTFTPVALSRRDGAYPSTVAVATAKAYTALNFGAPTHALRERIVVDNQRALASVEPRLMFVGGGFPIVQDGVTIGAVGVSGGSEDQDIECAQAALEGLGS